MTSIQPLSPGHSSVADRRRFELSGERLFGRDVEIRILDQLVARISERGGALVVRVYPGIGKSALLAFASVEASSRGVSVLRTDGAHSEIDLAFAGLHQLLRPFLGGLDRLPGPQREALSAAFGTMDVQVPDPFLIALAALNLLADVAERVPLLLLVDQAQWLDRPSARALAFVARRVEVEPIAVVFALQDGAASTLGAVGLRELHVHGLDDEAAAALLDAQGEALTPRLRQRVLKLAAGNPLALLELPDTLRRDDARADGLVPSSAMVTSKRETAFAEQASGLPAHTRDVLLLAAADERASALELLAAASLLEGAEVTLDALAPAEAAGLARVVDGSVTFAIRLLVRRCTRAQVARGARRYTRRWRRSSPRSLNVACGTWRRRPLGPTNRSLVSWRRSRSGWLAAAQSVWPQPPLGAQPR